MSVEVAAFQQSLTVWKTYSSHMVINAGGKAKAAISSADDMTLAANISSKHDIRISQALSSLKNGVNPAPSGYYDVVGHGTPYRIMSAQGQKLTAKEAASWITSQSDYVLGTNIRLVSCWTGRVCNGFAQKLANELGVTVMAPTTPVDIITLQPEALERMGAVMTTGQWRFFSPK